MRGGGRGGRRKRNGSGKKIGKRGGYSLRRVSSTSISSPSLLLIRTRWLKICSPPTGPAIAAVPPPPLNTLVRIVVDATVRGGLLFTRVCVRLFVRSFVRSVGRSVGLSVCLVAVPVPVPDRLHEKATAVAVLTLPRRPHPASQSSASPHRAAGSGRCHDRRLVRIFTTAAPPHPRPQSSASVMRRRHRAILPSFPFRSPHFRSSPVSGSVLSFASAAMADARR